MTDLPDGEWTPVLVGHQWPSGGSVSALGAAVTSRGAIEASFRAFGDRLQTAIDGQLGEQEGVTADDMRAAFRRGKDDAQRVAEANRVKKEAYGTARDAMTALRGQLTEYAGSGNREIQDVQKAKGSNADKVPKIVAIITKYQAQADHAAGTHAQTIMSAAQQVVDEEGAPALRDLASANGIELGRAQKPEGEQLQQLVQSTLKNDGGVPHHPPGATDGAAAPDSIRPPVTPDGRSGQTTAFGDAGHRSGEMSRATPNAAQRTAMGHAAQPTVSEPTPTPTPPVIHPSSPGPSGPASPSSGPATPPSVAPAPQAPVAAGAPATPGPAGGLPSAPTAAPGPQSSAPGPQTPAVGAPVHAADLPVHSSGAPSPSAASDAAPAHQAPFAAAPPAPVASVHPVPAGVLDTHPAVEHAQAAPYQPVAVAPGQPAAPPVTAPPTPATAPPAAALPGSGLPGSALPGYGADLRPAGIAASAAAAPLPAVPVVGTAAAGQAGIGQPAVVRTTPAHPSGPPAAPAYATATAAITGAAASQSADRDRLRRLVDAMARQQPRLCWAVGDFADGTTLVVTDLAAGWIPPGISLPATATVLEPKARRGDIEALLGAVVDSVVSTPSTRVPAPDPDPVNLSTRPLVAPEVDELGWELCRATQWRDGLPRLAHTLARAAVAGSGVPDNETALLRECLAAVGQKVLAAYPRPDAADIGTWQLLAAIAALADGHHDRANYHLAWFLAGRR